MKFKELKNFILEEMNPFQGKNYQPVMIKTLNQNKGHATKEQLKIELQKANPEHDLSFFSNCPVFNVLTKSHPVAEYDDENKTFHLLDYETFNDAEKTWITNYCEQKFSGESTQYVVLENKKEIDNAQKTMVDNPAPITTDFVYARLIGDRDLPENVYDHTVRNQTSIIQKWANRIKRLEKNQDVKFSWAVLNNHLEGFAPSSASTLGLQLGLEKIDFRDRNQKSVFDF